MTVKHTAHTVQKWLKYLFSNEVDELKRLVNLLPPSPTIVNIGAGGGTSGLAILEARPDSHLITIDITKLSSPYGCLAGEEDVLRSAGYWGKGRNRQIHGDSKLVGKNWEGDKVDMVFVDGGHSYTECRGDLLNWIPNIRDGGVVAVHDYKKVEAYEKSKLAVDSMPHPAPLPGVDYAVDIFCRKVFNFEQVSLINTLVSFRVDQDKVENYNNQEFDTTAYHLLVNLKNALFFGFAKANGSLALVGCGNDRVYTGEPFVLLGTHCPPTDTYISLYKGRITGIEYAGKYRLQLEEILKAITQNKNIEEEFNG